MANFKSFKLAVQKKLDLLASTNTTLFVTAVSKDAIWDEYLSAFPEGTNVVHNKRCEYDCTYCKQFLRPYGNIVAVVDNKLVSIWDLEGLEYPFNIVSKKLSDMVKSQPIVNVFISESKKLGIDSNKQMREDGSVKTWNHFYGVLPSIFVNSTSKSIESIQGTKRDVKNVFKRSLDELTLDAAQTILELINQGSLYRGEEHKKAINTFIEYKITYDNIDDAEKDNWCWVNSINNPVAKIRNTAIGTMLIDLSEGIELDVAVRKFDNVMAPSNYKRPNAIFTKKMIEDAEKKIIELGYEESLARRHAVVEDITINNVLFVNRDARKKMNSSVFDDMKEEIKVNPKTFNKVEEVSIDDFVKNIIPTATNIEVMMESKHQGNLMSLVAPKNREAPSILKWNNNFSWGYNGDIADSMKQNVKNAGGNVDGVLRFSIQWNDGDNNQNDFDAHCVEPNGNLIYFSNKGRIHPSSGMLDVDIVHPGNNVAVENITWTDIRKMHEGKYTFIVHNFSHNGGHTGFTAEIEYDGQIYSYSYDKELKHKEEVIVAEINFTRKDGIKFIKSLDSNSMSKEIWGIATNKFSKVSMCMFSPNYWDDQIGIGNCHYFFILDGCKNENQPRGFFNEFLKEDLMEHKRVFEALGSKMRVEYSDNQLSGLGFSTTQRNSIIVKVDGSFNRTLKINF